MSIVFLVFVFMTIVGRVHGQNKTSLPSGWYRGVSSDSSGTYLTAVVDSGPIYYSNDSGVSWQVSDAPSLSFYNAVAASSTGQYVIASSYRSKSMDFGTLVSSDYGQHFTSASTHGESAVAVSATGQYMVSMHTPPSSPNYCVSYSDNYGVSFTTSLGPNTVSSYCEGIAIDSSGTYVVLSVYSQGLWVSNNVLNVSSWQLTYKADIPIEAIAFGGTSFYAGYASTPGYVIQSTDYGYNWTVKGSIPTVVYSMAVDSTGVNVLVSSYTGLYLSNDSGLSFEWIYSGSVSQCAMNDNTNLTIFLAESEYSGVYDVYVGNPRKKAFIFLSFLYSLLTLSISLQRLWW